MSHHQADTVQGFHAVIIECFSPFRMVQKKGLAKTPTYALSVFRGTRLLRLMLSAGHRYGRLFSATGADAANAWRRYREGRRRRSCSS